MLTIREIKVLGVNELNFELKKARHNLYLVTAQVRTKKEKATHKLKLAKINLARILTVMSEMKKITN